MLRVPLALLTGQYPHLNGVYTNNPNSSTKPVGGWRAFKQNGDMAKSVNVALKSAGYYTGFMGKYLNGYDVATVNGTKVAPEIPTGWDSWRPIYGAGYKQWGWMYSASTAGKTFLGKRPLSRKDADYSTNVMANWGVDFIKRHKSDVKPYFLEISTYGTHSRTFGRAHSDDPLFPPAYADRPGHTKKYGNCGLVACPHMNVRNLPGFNDDRIDNTPVYADGTRAKPWQPNDLVVNSDLENRRYRNRAQMAQSIDRLIGRVRATVGPNTYVVLTSDNGFHLGQHRLHYGKSTPYSSDAKVPLVVVGPGVVPGARSQLVGNVDLAPTFETSPAWSPPGAGRLQLPARAAGPGRPGNSYTFFEHTYSNTNPDTDPDFDSDLGGSSVTLPSYLAIRSKDTLLVRWDLDKTWPATTTPTSSTTTTANPYERTNVYASTATSRGCRTCRPSSTSTPPAPRRSAGRRAGPGPGARPRPGSPAPAGRERLSCWGSPCRCPA